MKHLSHILQNIINDKNSTGFTLIEMLVSLVIVAIIVASIYTAFDCGKNSWQVGETITQRYQNARAALDFMSREISAMYITASSIYKTGLIYDSDSFRFVACIPEDDNDWDLRKIGYRHNAEKIQRSYLTTDLDTLTDASMSSGWQLLVGNIYGLDFTCLDATFTEQSTWNSVSSGELPKAVIITINVQDDKKLQPAQTFSTIVRIPGSER